MPMKTCPLCDNKIQWRHKLCRACFRIHAHYMQEPWFREIADLQYNQDTIDIVEAYQIPYSTPTDLYGTQAPFEHMYVKKAGSHAEKPRTLQQRVLDLYDESLQHEKDGTGQRLALRQIAKLLDNNISYCGVRNILRKKRAGSFGVHWKRSKRLV